MTRLLPTHKIKIGAQTFLLPKIGLLTSKTEVLQTPSAIKSKPRSRGRVVKVFEFLKNIEFLKSFN